MLQDAGIMSTLGMSPPKGLTTVRNAAKLNAQKSDQPLMNKKRIDLIFCSVNKHKPFMSFDVFLQVLIKIAEFKFSDSMNPSEAL